MNVRNVTIGAVVAGIASLGAVVASLDSVGIEVPRPAWASEFRGLESRVLDIHEHQVADDLDRARESADRIERKAATATDPELRDILAEQLQRARRRVSDLEADLSAIRAEQIEAAR